MSFFAECLDAKVDDGLLPCIPVMMSLGLNALEDSLKKVCSSTFALASNFVLARSVGICKATSSCPRKQLCEALRPSSVKIQFILKRVKDLKKIMSGIVKKTDYLQNMVEKWKLVGTLLENAVKVLEHCLRAEKACWKSLKTTSDSFCSTQEDCKCSNRFCLVKGTFSQLGFGCGVLPELVKAEQLMSTAEKHITQYAGYLTTQGSGSMVTKEKKRSFSMTLPLLQDLKCQWCSDSLTDTPCVCQSKADLFSSELELCISPRTIRQKKSTEDTSLQL